MGTTITALCNFTKPNIRTSSQKQETFQQLVDESVRKSVRNNSDDIIFLPKQLWCSLKEFNDGRDICCEVGWVTKPGHAVTSKCTFSGKSVLKASLFKSY